MPEERFIVSNYSKNLSSGIVSWQSPSNIALVKYWGKYGEQLPMNPSISFTLKNCITKTSLSFESKTSEEFDFEVYLGGKREKSFEPKIEKFFERVEVYLPFLKDFKFKIETSNSNSFEFFGSKDNEVLVLQFFNVKLIEGFIGNCSPYFPQYFINAILLGDCQETVPDDKFLE